MIDYLDETLRLTSGCTKLSPACDNCYALREAARLRAHPSAKIADVYKTTWDVDGWTGEIVLHDDRLDIPYHWKRPRRIGLCFHSDLLHSSVPFEFLDKVWRIIDENPRHTFVILTKRSSRLCSFERLPDAWFGMTVENADHKWRMDALRRSAAEKCFVSFEPLLGDLGELDLTGIGWCAAGGESGPKARPTHPDWARSVRDQCVAAGVPFFFKQVGEWAWEYDDDGIRPGDICMDPDGFIDTVPDEGYYCLANESSGTWMRRVGKKLAGHLLDGREWHQLPEEVRT